MSVSLDKNEKVFSLALDGFEGPIDLLLNLAKEHKIDISKISILKLALQFLEYIIKRDIEIAAEYLVMGAWLAFSKSKLLLPSKINDDAMDIEEMSELLEFQMKKLESMQKVSKLLFKKHQLGIHFFKRGKAEYFVTNQKFLYQLSLHDLIKSYHQIVTSENSNSITIARSKLYSVDEASKRLKLLMSKTDGWKNLFEFIPKNITDKLEKKSAVASHFVASLELVKEGHIFLKQDGYNKNIYLTSKSNL